MNICNNTDECITRPLEVRTSNIVFQRYHFLCFRSISVGTTLIQPQKVNAVKHNGSHNCNENFSSQQILSFPSPKAHKTQNLAHIKHDLKSCSRPKVEKSNKINLLNVYYICNFEPIWAVYKLQIQYKLIESVKP